MSLLGQLLLSLSLEHPHTEEGRPAPLEVDIRLGSSRFLNQGEDKNIWDCLLLLGLYNLDLLWRFQLSLHRVQAKKGQLGVSTYSSKPFFGQRTHNIYQLH